MPLHFLWGLALASVASISHGHSWLACCDYRGDVNYFDQEKCMARPRQWWEREPQAKGYQIADEPPSRAWGSLGCDIPMSKPDWKSGYSAQFPYAIYEPGKVYCLAWPMKNHAILSAKCTNPNSKSDPSVDESLTLRVSYANPSADPAQAEFDQRNINELAGLATNCSHTWTEPEELNREWRDECQLGLEKHQNGELDCKGFQRSPKFCENSGAAMGTGCFKVPSEMAPGHYVAQWHWDAAFVRDWGRQAFAYTTCFDFEVVPAGSSLARPGTPGTLGIADTSELPCLNNVLKFSSSGSPSAPTAPLPDSASAPEPVETSPVPAPEPAPAGTSLAPPEPEPEPEPAGTSSMPAPQQKPVGHRPTQAPVPLGDCSLEGQQCAGPGWTGPKCCISGYKCVYQNEYWSKCLPDSTSSCSPQGHQCAGPGWTGPTCCTAGNKCVYQNQYWSKCVSESLVEMNSQHHSQQLAASEQRLVAFRRRPQSKFLSSGQVLMQTRMLLSNDANFKLGKGADL